MENKAEFSTVTISTQHLEDLITYQSNYFALVNWLEWAIREDKYMSTEDYKEMLELVGESVPDGMKRVVITNMNSREDG